MMFSRVFCLLTLLCMGSSVIQAADEPSLRAKVKISGGAYKPFYPNKEKPQEVNVAPLSMDTYLVTNKEFLDFVKENPAWRKGEVSSLFADPQYLSHWLSPLKLGPQAQPMQPVTYVSWFAADAFCKAHGGRLPQEAEWEFTAQASETNPNGQKDSAWKQKILDWYSKPNVSALPNVGAGKPNYWGVYNMHGLVWEWVADFNSTLMSTDSRAKSNQQETKFCGSGALSATDKENYATFMRYAFRSSLEATFTTSSLGFRCAYDLKKGN